MRPAISTPARWQAAPRIRSALFLPERRALAAASMTALSTRAGDRAGKGGAAQSASPQAASAGTSKVAIWPGGPQAAATAAAPSAATLRDEAVALSQCDIGRQMP